MPRQAYLDVAEVTARLLEVPAVAECWDTSSVLEKFQVSGLAGHLARSITQVQWILAKAAPGTEPITLHEHYARAAWIGVHLDAEDNVRIRRDGAAEAAGGAASLATEVRLALDRLHKALPAEPLDRVVHLPWGPWSLSLDDFLTTRILEMAVHCDDLALSVDVPTPPLPAPALRPILELLTQLAVDRHGATAVLRALTRAERAPNIAAI